MHWPRSISLVVGRLLLGLFVSPESQCLVTITASQIAQPVSITPCAQAPITECLRLICLCSLVNFGLRKFQTQFVVPANHMFLLLLGWHCAQVRTSEFIQSRDLSSAWVRTNCSCKQKLFMPYSWCWDGVGWQRHSCLYSLWMAFQFIICMVSNAGVAIVSPRWVAVIVKHIGLKNDSACRYSTPQGMQANQGTKTFTVAERLSCNLCA